MISRDDETDLDASTPSRRSADAVIMVRSPGATDVIRLEEGKSLVVGRGADAGLVLDDTKASRAHLTLRMRAGVLFAEDLGGRNGTRVNDRVIRGEAVVLRSGDRVFIGDTELVAVVPERRVPDQDFLEIELSQMLATRGAAVTLVRVAFSAPPPDETLDAIDHLVGEEGVVVQRHEREVFALLRTSEARRVMDAIAARAPGSRLASARHPEEGRTAEELARAAERSAGIVGTARSDIIVADPAMVDLYALVERIANGPTTVLLLGETGVGKEIVAEAIHQGSPRRDRPFVKINCGALPESLLESELFGHEKGAFTGADRAKVGLFEAAHGGTIFLDEIGEMSPSAQVRFLRVLEARTLTRVGGVHELPVDVRVVCATHRDPLEAIERGAFRQDLYYRVATTVLRIPPLRDRPFELPLLARMFAEQAGARMGFPPPALDPEVLELMSRHRFPGNVRELRNAMEHAVVLAGGGRVSVEHLPETLRPREATPVTRPVKASVADAERVAIERALAQTGGNRTHAATLLGVSRRTLVYKLARYGIGGKR